MSRNQPPNDRPDGDEPTGTPPAASPHGASAVPPPPPYGRPPGEYGAQSSDQQQGYGPAWNQQPHPGYGPQGQPDFPQGPPPQDYPQGYNQPQQQPGAYPPGYYYAVDPPKSRLAAGLLGIFLGGFGVHRFYLGYTSIGVVQILVTIFTWGFGAIWGFVEGIMILAGAQTFRTDARGVPLRE